MAFVSYPTAPRPCRIPPRHVRVASPRPCRIRVAVPQPTALARVDVVVAHCQRAIRNAAAPRLDPGDVRRAELSPGPASPTTCRRDGRAPAAAARLVPGGNAGASAAAARFSQAGDDMWCGAARRRQATAARRPADQSPAGAHARHRASASFGVPSSPRASDIILITGSLQNNRGSSAYYLVPRYQGDRS